MKSLDGRVVVLTGAAGGIGRAIAACLSAKGATLALVDRDTAGLAELAATLPAERCTTHVFDLQATSELERLADEVTARHPAIHVLINNAGLTVHGAFRDQTRDEIDRVLDVDLRAVVHTTRVFLPHLEAAAPGHVVNVASMAGLAGFPFQSTYCAAKFALRGFGQALRPELAALNIGVTTVLPGTIATGFLAAAGTHDKATSDKLASLMLRYGTPPHRVATAIRRGIRWDWAEMRVGWDCRLLSFVGWLCPPLVPWVLRIAYRRGHFGAAESTKADG